MLVSYNWLKKYVKLPPSLPAEDVAQKLNLSTVEVENIAEEGKNTQGIVVGKVLSAEKHPDADKLKVCAVDAGDEKLQIVCGGSNVEKGMLVALAKVGSKVRWHGEGDLIELKPTAIRGVESFGMICSSAEIGLAEMFPPKEEKEILNLSFLKRAPGTPIAEALDLGDVILEIDNKSLSHRPDLWGHYGIAREVAALFRKDFSEFEDKELKSGKEVKLKVSVEDKKICPRYMAVAVEGVKVAESPAWLKKSLNSVGVRSINNIVDITNYIMMDLGQPMHAFSAEVLSKNSKDKNQKFITVRRAKPGERIVAIDEKDYSLGEEDIIIADEDGPLAVAGVIGGKDSGINLETKTIIFESANFDPASIRRTSAKLGLRTDSAVRFEKSLDPNMCELALKKAVELVLQVCPEAKVASPVIDKSDFVLPVGPLEISASVFKEKLGLDIPSKEIIDILTRLGFGLKEKRAGIYSVKIPTHRATKDIALAEDLVEEVARIYGFDNIPTSLPNFPIVPPLKNILRDTEHVIRNILVKGLGFDEVYNYSFISASQIERMGDSTEKYVELDNPLSKEKPFLRRSLLPNILENVLQNFEYFSPLKIMEIGKVYLPEEAGERVEANGDELLPKQSSWLTAVYIEKKQKEPFWEVRRIVEFIAKHFNLKLVLKEKKSLSPWLHPARAGEVFFEDACVGEVYELNPVVAKKFGLEDRLGVLEINLNALSGLVKNNQMVYRPLPIYPEVRRDVSFVVDKGVLYENLSTAISAVDSLIRSVSLFDVYAGANVGENKKSMAFRIVLSSPERTLQNEEVEKIMEKVGKILVDKFGAEMRK